MKVTMDLLWIGVGSRQAISTMELFMQILISQSIKPKIIISKLFIGNPPNICKIDKLNELNVKLANYGNFLKSND
jgi:hypothetical protein